MCIVEEPKPLYIPPGCWLPTKNIPPDEPRADWSVRTPLLQTPFVPPVKISQASFKPHSTAAVVAKTKEKRRPVSAPPHPRHLRAWGVAVNLHSHCRCCRRRRHRHASLRRRLTGRLTTTRSRKKNPLRCTVARFPLAVLLLRLPGRSRARFGAHGAALPPVVAAASAAKPRTWPRRGPPFLLRGDRSRVGVLAGVAAVGSKNGNDQTDGGGRGSFPCR